jgi:hypothetical protein
LEKTLPVVERWQAIVRVYDGGRQAAPTPAAPAPCDAARGAGR